MIRNSCLSPVGMPWTSARWTILSMAAGPVDNPVGTPSAFVEFIIWPSSLLGKLVEPFTLRLWGLGSRKIALGGLRSA